MSKVCPMISGNVVEVYIIVVFLNVLTGISVEKVSGNFMLLRKVWFRQ